MEVGLTLGSEMGFLSGLKSCLLGVRHQLSYVRLLAAPVLPPPAFHGLSLRGSGAL